MSRSETLTQKVKTPFGSMYLHCQLNDAGQPVGGSISDPSKEPESTIAELVENLSAGLNELLKIAGER